MHKIFLFSLMSLGVIADDVINPNVDMVYSYNEYYKISLPIEKNNCHDLSISGYMFGHSHGLPTNPEITYKNNSCIVEGLMFSMPGVWSVIVSREQDLILKKRFNVK
ncbi:hypothetical protein [uncultured Vibrio sp.]|uniref:hypothetical protein n=1 Tax=uncultured Vibrio sp. TaxID=114054 RepID=UPI002610AE3B|nr:hypothetical protein [uncultured Vibrio sp.]